MSDFSISSRIERKIEKSRNLEISTSRMSITFYVEKRRAKPNFFWRHSLHIEEENEKKIGKNCMIDVLVN